VTKAVLMTRRGPVGMLLTAVVLAMPVACTSSADGGGASASCAFLVHYRDHEYRDLADVDFEVGGRLGPAGLPSCDDTPNDDGDGDTASTPTTAYAVEGLDPAIGIAVGDDPGDARFVAVLSGTGIPPEVEKMIRGS
jgi:hypothetical protein